MAVAGSGLRGFLSAALSRGALARLNVRRLHGSCPAPLESGAKPAAGRQAREIPADVPPRKAKNPMKTVAVAWAIGFPSGILLFLLTKRQVDRNRLKQLKARQKMKGSNVGEYERTRYRRSPQGLEGTAHTKA